MVVPGGRKHEVSEVFHWIQVRRVWGPVIGINFFILQEPPAYSSSEVKHCRAPGGSQDPVHQVLTMVSKGFIEIPNGSQVV